MAVFTYELFLCILLASVRLTIMSCGGGYFSDENGKCTLCPLHCPFCDSKEKCLSCDSGYWGEVCKFPCSKCQNGTSCEKTNGFCLDACRDGVSGMLCDAQCSQNCSSCSRTNVYSCLKCAPGRYPLESCQNVCSKCYNTTCDEDGNCTSGCVEGYWGNNCESICSQHCLNKFCDQDSGDCSHGCDGIYTGTRCDIEEKTTKTVTIFVIVGIAVLIIAVIILLARCFLRARRNRKKKLPGPKQKGEKEAFIAGSNDNKGQDSQTGVINKFKGVFKQKTTVQRRMQKLQTLLKSIEHRTEEICKKEFEKLPNRWNKENLSNEEGQGEQEVLSLMNNVVTLRRKTGMCYTTSASFIKDLSGSKYYIASKGPTAEDNGFTEFWTMLKQMNCKTVVMLYNIDKSNLISEKYWPDTTNTYGNLFVRIRGGGIRKEYDTKTFEVKEGCETMSVNLLHYSQWPEKGITNNVQLLLDFRTAVNKATPHDSGPLVVLSRNGEGRTGTYIALDMLLTMVDDMTDSVDDKEIKDIDVFACVMHLRQQRQNMVETDEQYLFLYQGLSCYISRILNYTDRKEKEIPEDNKAHQAHQTEHSVKQ